MSRARAEKTSPFVVCIHHPAEVDLPALQARLAGLEVPVELHVLAFKESVKLRLARQTPPISEALASSAPIPSSQIKAAWQEANALLTIDLPGAYLSDMPRLQFVQAYSAGIEQFPVEQLTERGIALSTAAGAGAPAIAEFVLGRLVEVFRNTREIESMQRARQFHRPGGRTLSGKTIGIVGLGAIGSEVARLASAFGMKTRAIRRSASMNSRSDLVDRLDGPDGLNELLEASDVVVLAAPGTAETENMIDAEALGRMRAGAVLCNVARGRLVDELALVRALESSSLGAAILDVTRKEPLPTEDPLFSAPNVYLSPHSSITPDAYDARILDLFCENLERFLEGKSLRNLANTVAST